MSPRTAGPGRDRDSARGPDLGGADGDPRLAASLMCADLLHLEAELLTLAEGGIDYLHMDIMDGHYVPNLALSPDLCRHVAQVSALPQDIHLMVEQVDAFLPMFAPLQPAFVTFHPEVSRHPVRTIEAIRAAGGVPGIALDPGLAVATIEPLLAEVGVVCIMTVSPGYAGQKLIPWTLEKIAVLRERRAQAGLDFRIEVDGNASWENIPHMQAAGADIIVAGSSSLFSDRIPRREALRRLRGVMEAPSKPVEQTEGGAP